MKTRRWAVDSERLASPSRPDLSFSIVGGADRAGGRAIGNGGHRVVGSVWFFISLILVGACCHGQHRERTERNRTWRFLMSLPVSSIQYTTSKLYRRRHVPGPVADAGAGRGRW